MPIIILTLLLLLALTTVAIALAGLATFVAVVLRARAWARTAAPPASTPVRPSIDDESFGRMIALRAYLVGRRGDAGRHQVSIRRASEPVALEELGAERSRDDLWRQLFYALVLAELDRRADPLHWRRIAKAAAARISDDEDNAFARYMRAVDATTNTVDTGNFADITRNGAHTLIADERIAARAIGVTDAEVERHDHFLFVMPVEQWC